MTTAITTHVHLPPHPKRGEVILVQAKITHPMSNGWPRKDAPDAPPLARNMLKSFRCFLNNVLVFESLFFEGAAPYPYLAFKIRANESGELICRWEGENGEVFETKRYLAIE